MNLCVGDIFKKSNLFSIVAEQAVQLVSFFHRSTFFLGRLRSEQAALYKSYVSFVSPNSTRWNSHYLCFASIIKSRAALKSLATKIEDDDNEDFKSFPRDLLLNISNNEWWKNLTQLKVLLEPYMASLNKLQRDKGCLTEVLHSFGWICQVIKGILDQELKDYLMTKLEKRWSAWEQPLLFLSFLLHPDYRITQFNQNIDGLSFAHMGHWVVHYYKSWFGKSPHSILRELQCYENEEYPFNKETFNQFGGDILQYWNFCKGVAVELHLVATRIFSICITTASVERLFSAMGWYHSLRRNRLEANLFNFFILSSLLIRYHFIFNYL